MKMKWNDRLAAALQSSDYSKSGFAAAVGVSAPTVTDWLNGTIKVLKAENADSICDVLGIRMKWLLYGKGHKYQPSPETGSEAPGAPFGNIEEPGYDIESMDPKLLEIVSLAMNGALNDEQLATLRFIAEQFASTQLSLADTELAITPEELKKAK